MIGRRALTALGVAAAFLAAPHLARAADEPTRLFAQGNERYAAGDFEEAARCYRQLLDQGYGGAAVHYNLGNALYKLRQLGPAILELEKAHALAGNDPDIEANLEFLRSQTADKISEGGAQTTTFFVERLLALTTVDQDAVVLGLVWIVAGALWGILIAARTARLRNAAIWGLAVMALPVIVAAGTFGIKLHRAGTEVHAVVMKERLDVLSGPGEDNTTLFTVHEGLKVRVRNQQGSWSQVSLENGLNGWVPASALGAI